MSHLKTHVLIEKAQQGNKDALEELCSRYYSRVLAAVRLRLGDGLRRKLDSGDVVQEVFIDAVRRVPTFDFKTEGAFLHYLNRVVECKIRDKADHWNAQMRKIGKEVSLEDPSSPEFGGPLNVMQDRAIPTPSEIVSLREDLALLEAAMDKLSEQSQEYRDLLIAVKIEGRTYREIGDEMGKTPDSVRMMVNRAMKALARAFEEAEAGERKSISTKQTDDDSNAGKELGAIGVLETFGDSRPPRERYED